MSKAIHILVVDDDRMTVHLLERVLRKHGYHVHTAFDGAEGLQKARTLKPDLIILDIMMPGLDGYQVCYQLHREPETTHIAVLMLTTKGGLDQPQQGGRSLPLRIKERLHGFDVGAADFISKPVTAALLLEHVRTLLWSGKQA
ncbi:MAG: response regulator [Ardenticatenaceae bacterium]|nr:response regulator [Ardenticatenaceae bacterium]